MSSCVFSPLHPLRPVHPGVASPGLRRIVGRFVLLLLALAVGPAGAGEPARYEFTDLPPPALPDGTAEGCTLATASRWVTLEAPVKLSGPAGRGARPLDRVRWSARDSAANPAPGEGLLPLALAAPGVTVSGESVYLAGGLSREGGSRQVWRLAWDGAGALVPERLPDLPVALALPGLMAGPERLYVVGGAELEGSTGGAAGHPWIHWLDLRPGVDTWETARLPEGCAPVAPLLLRRHDDVAVQEALFLVGGLSPTDSGLVSSPPVWKFLPARGVRPDRWTRLADLPGGWWPRVAAPAGATQWLVAATADPISLGTGDQASAAAATVRLLAYHSVSDRWVDSGWAGPAGVPLAFEPGPHRSWHLTGRAPEGPGWAREVRVTLPEAHLGFLDYALIALYLAVMVGIGAHFSKKERTSEDYFLGGRRIPWWAAGISIWATGVSSISFMAIPAKTYATNWHRISESVMSLFAVTVAAFLFVPMLRRLNLVTMMEYLEMRFHPALRYVATALMVLSQIGGRLSTTILLPSLALNAVTGVNLYLSIAVLGVITTIYTAQGGFHAVIWTDVAQTFLMFGGALLTLFLIVGQLQGGVGALCAIATREAKVHPFDWTWDFTTPTVWIFLLWGLGDLFNRMGQETAQRVFSTESDSAARKAMMTSLLVSIPGTLIFFGTGTALFAYYLQRPERLDPGLPTNDYLVPFFVAQNLPAGVAGLIIAGILAAAMSTLSGMNSVATVVLQDFYRWRGRVVAESDKVRTARRVTVVIGLFATAAAMYMGSMDIRSLWDNFSKLMSLFGGGFGGVGVLGLLTRRANTTGALVGTVCGTAVLWFVTLQTQIHFLIYGIIALATCFVTGYLASLVWPGPSRDLTGLTIWTMRRR